MSLHRLALLIIIAILPLAMLPQLPGLITSLLLLILPVLLLFVKHRLAIDLSVIIVFFLFASFTAHHAITPLERYTRQAIDADIKVVETAASNNRLKLRLIRVNNEWVFPPLYVVIHRADEKSHYCVGQRWRMTLKLLPVHGSLNQGGYDLQRQSLAKATPLTGRITAQTVSRSSCDWRGRWVKQYQQDYQQLTWSPVLMALLFGLRDSIPQSVNQLLRETGTAHLMAISGMHIGLAAGFGIVCARILQRGFPANRIGYRFPLLCGAVMALLYTSLSGAAPPALRAMLALAMWGLLKIRGYHCSGWHIWQCCIATILFFDPLSILSDSLWLSAIAVAALLIWYTFFPLPWKIPSRWLHGLVSLLHLQLGLFILLMPVQMMVFQGISLSALIANVWAVPIVSLFTLPLLLTGLLLHSVPWITDISWWLADKTLALVFTPLQSIPTGWVSVSNHQSLWGMMIWVILFCLRCPLWRTSPLTMLAAIILMASWRSNIDRPVWRVDMLDVGHGLAMVISASDRAIIYDTGNRWGDSDAAQRVILPWLTWHGLNVEHIILSHEHMDHVGGLNSLKRAYPSAMLHSNMPESVHHPCHQGVNWQWQGLTVQMLWPPADENRAGNNQSCVVMISDGRWRVLLTGDIEAETERSLVRYHRYQLQADLLQVAHHGSRTSSTAPFLRAVSASAGMASAARFNAWGFPAKSVRERFAEQHYRWLDTALEGQVTARFYPHSWRIDGLRSQIKPRWFHDWFGVPRDSR